MKHASILACAGFCLAGLCTSGSAWAQTQVSGVYVDSLTNEGIPFATVALYPQGAPADKPEQVLLTEPDGSFMLTTKKNADYSLAISFTGNRPVSVPVAARGKSIALGSLLAVAANEKLDGVTVVASRPIIRAEVDRMAYDVENDPDAPAKTVLDMLRKTPMVTVDGQDNIQVNGSANFKIYVNERKTSMFDNNASQTLKSMPASAVKSIEVITAPGAKYDAEGVGGIINLVMSSSTKMGGVTATVNAAWEIGRSKSMGYNLTGQAGNLTVSSNGNIYRGSSVNEMQYHMENRVNQLVQETQTKMKETNLNGYNFLELSWEIDTMNLVTGSVNYYQGYNKQVLGGNNNKAMQKIGDAEPSYFGINTSGKYRWSGLSFDAGYEHKFTKKNILTLSGHYSFRPNSGSDSENLYTPLGEGTKVVGTNSSVGSTDEDSKEGIVQADYLTSINDNNKIEAGLKYTYRNNGSDGLTTYLDSYTGDEVFTHLSDLTQEQNIFAAYASYNFKIGNFGTKAGVRYETAKLDVTSRENGIDELFNYKTNDIVPSIFMSYNFSPASSIRLNYNMRIQRPGTHYLNPYEKEDVPGIVSSGNPDLESEKHHRIGLGFNKAAQKFFFNADLSYSFCGNSIEYYNFIDKDERIRYTYGNIGKRQNVGLDFYANVTFSQYTSMWANGRVEYVNILGKADGVDERAEGFTGRIFAGLNQKLPWQINGSIFYGINGKRIQFQQEMKSMMFYALTLTRPFFKERLQVGIQATNPFKKTLNLEQEQWSKDAYSHIQVDYHMRSVQLNVSYRFGDLKAKVRKTGASIDNSDMMQGGKGGNGGSQTGVSM